jgi:hypothetical protein
MSGVGNLLDPGLQRSTIAWDQDDGSWSGIWRCKGCGRFLGKHTRVRAGGLEAPPCRTKTCDGYVNRIGFETFAPPTR